MNFSPKYLQQDSLKAACGAPIRLEIRSLADSTRTVPPREVPNVCIEARLLYLPL